MLRNTVDQTQEITNRQRFPKNNSFCYRWRILDDFSRSIDRQMFHLKVAGAGNHRSLLADKILQLYKGRYHGTRQDLIVELAQDAMKFLEKRRFENHKLSKAEVMLSKATTELMDRVFNTLLAFSTELNSLLGLSELFMTATEPEVKKRSNNSETSIAVSVQAHLSTSLYRLVIEGKTDSISFYVIPSDNILALPEISLHYEAIAVWRPQITAQGQVYWLSTAGILTEEMVDVSCAELLRKLLETTQERLAPSERLGREENCGFDLLEVDPWMQTQSSAAIEADFNQKSGHALANDENGFEYETDDSGWNHLEDVPNQAFDKKHVYANRFGDPSANPYSNMPSVSMSISTDAEPARHTLSSEGTRTDSVPSLATLLRESGNFSAQGEATQDVVLEPAIVRDAVIVEDPEVLTPGMIGAPQAQNEPNFDLKKEYFADTPESKKASKKGMASKRSTKKSNSKRGKRQGR